MIQLATYSITQVYLVRADDPRAATATLQAAQERGGAQPRVRLEFESVQLRGMDDVLPAKAENPWLGELKRQLLGHEVAGQQPASGKRQS